jgi:alpha,alpha-trehalase
MKKIIITLQLIVIYSLTQAQTASPRQLFPGLFEAVQMSTIFPDSKTFVDATPKRTLLQLYRITILKKQKRGSI